MSDAGDFDPDKPQLTLTVTEGPERGHVFAFTNHDVLIAGRCKQAALHLKDHYFSRYHFMIEVNPPLCHLTDMGSRNGTLVNGAKVQSVALRDGDEIKAGHTALRVAMSRPAAPPTMPGGCPPRTQPHKIESAVQTVSGSAALPQRSLAATQQPAAAHTPRPTPPRGTNRRSASPCNAPLALPGYEILEELGRGGMGTVCRAKRLADGATVAVKAVIPTAAASNSQLQRFLREAIILCQLRHPNIVGFQDLLLVAGSPVIIMEYVEGKDVAKLLHERGPLPACMAVRIMLQVLAALHYAHAKGFVHRDMKPENVLIVNKDGGKTVKLADFGLARVYQESRLSGLTLHGHIGGTIAFMPPEQITEFRQVRPAADQYSAAATLYNLLTNQLLFDFTGSTVDGVAQVLQSQPIPILKRRPELPPELARIIHQALAKDPAERFASVQAFAGALEPFAQASDSGQK